MTTFRLISLPAHGAAEMLLGLAVMAAPFVFGFGAAALIVSVIIGALIVGVAFSTLDEGSRSISAHHANDVALAFGLMVASIATGIAADGAAAVVFAVAAVLQVALLLTTRYSAAR